MSTPLLSLQNVRLGFGGRPLFSEVELAVLPGDRLCLVGRNGCGKSTLLKIAAGELLPDEGERILKVGCKVAYVPQEPVLPLGLSLRDYVATALRPEHRADLYRAESLLGELGLDPDRPTVPLSGGELRRVVLAWALAGEPDVLLLDEPTNHLDLPTIEWLEKRLSATKAAVVLISHDRAFLNRLTRKILWLDRGVLRKNPTAGFEAFEAWSEAALLEEERSTARLDRLLTQEIQWSREGISARRTRNMGRMRRLEGLRAERRDLVARQGDVKLVAERGEASGKLVLEATGISKAFGERVLIKDLSLTLLRGGRLGIIGPNGAGKTTLIRMLMGELEPDRGRVRVGTQLTPVYLDQARASLDPERTVQETLAEEGTDQVLVQGKPRHVHGYLKDFLFSAQQARSPVGSLSGGERNRLLLARALARPSNLLVLDEPTNDLDMDTLDVLQEVLSDYEGTLIIVSHDRDFLDRVVTSTLALEGDGTAVEYGGGYSDYRSQKARAEQAERARAEEAARKAQAKAPPPPPKAPRPVTRLTYQQNKALTELPVQIAALEDEVARLEALLSDPDAYGRDRAAFDAAVARVPIAKAELATAEEAWLELECLRETLGR